jgi:hypothetical protein
MSQNSKKKPSNKYTRRGQRQAAWQGKQVSIAVGHTPRHVVFKMGDLTCHLTPDVAESLTLAMADEIDKCRAELTKATEPAPPEVAPEAAEPSAP